jgi:RsiW-degrading membrane proteinase PrsW (M82 family)
MEIAFTAICALLPSLILLRYFYRSDVHPEPRGVLVKTFLLGVLIFVPVVMVGFPLLLLKPALSHPLLDGLYLGFLCIAIPEEAFKFLVVTRYSARHPAFDEPMDGIVYGATASLGFATLENVLYVAGGGWGVALLRAVTALPMHASLGAILGYYVGQAKFAGARRAWAWKGLLAAVVIHGLYDFPLLAMLPMATGQTEAAGGDFGAPGWKLALLALPLGVLIFAAVWTVRLVRRLRREQLQAAQPATAKSHD